MTWRTDKVYIEVEQVNNYIIEIEIRINKVLYI